MKPFPKKDNIPPCSFPSEYLAARAGYNHKPIELTKTSKRRLRLSSSIDNGSIAQFLFERPLGARCLER